MNQSHRTQCHFKNTERRKLPIWFLPKHPHPTYKYTHINSTHILHMRTPDHERPSDAKCGDWAFILETQGSFSSEQWLLHLRRIWFTNELKLLINICEKKIIILLIINDKIKGFNARKVIKINTLKLNFFTWFTIGEL